MAFSDPWIWPKLKVIHCGVIPEEFGEPVAHNDGELKIVCVGRLVPEKGQAVLLRALEQLAEAGIDASVVFVGDGRSRAWLEAEASRRNIRATFTGSVGHEDVPALLAEADVFCLPSFAEGVPVVLMEAMASRLPVVTTRIAGIPELVEDGVTGFVVSPGREDQLASALAELARSPALARSMGAAGRTKVCEEFNARTSAFELACLFAGLGSPSPGSGAVTPAAVAR
jgi:glycosyltransferase involved in cell wall biosynthesis